MTQLTGIIPAVITPMTKDGEVDLNAVERLVSFLINAGVHGLHPCGTTGEVPLLTSEERKALAQKVVEAANSRVPVVVQVGHIRTSEAVSLAKHAYEVGATAISIVTPYYYILPQEALFEYFVQVARSVPDDFPIYLYNIPQCTNNPVLPQLLERVMAICPNVVGIKHSQPDLDRLAAYLAATKGRARIFAGSDTLILPSLFMGAVGAVSGNANVFPEIFVGLYKAFQNGDFVRAKQFQLAITSVAKLLGNGSNLACFKAALGQRGIHVGGVRAPLKGLEPEERVSLEETMAKFMADERLGVPARPHV